MTSLNYVRESKPCGYYYDKVSADVRRLRKTKNAMDHLTGSLSLFWAFFKKERRSLDILLNTEIETLASLSMTTAEMSEIHSDDQDHLLVYHGTLGKRIEGAREDSRAYKPPEITIPENSKDVLNVINAMPAEVHRYRQEMRSKLIQMVEQNTREYAFETKSLATQSGVIAEALNRTATIFRGEYEHLREAGPVKLHALEAGAVGRILGEVFADIREMNDVMMHNVSEGYRQLISLPQMGILPAKYIRRIELLPP